MNSYLFTDLDSIPNKVFRIQRSKYFSSNPNTFKILFFFKRIRHCITNTFKKHFISYREDATPLSMRVKNVICANQFYGNNIRFRAAKCFTVHRKELYQCNSVLILLISFIQFKWLIDEYLFFFVFFNKLNKKLLKVLLTNNDAIEKTKFFCVYIENFITLLWKPYSQSWFSQHFLLHSHDEFRDCEVMNRSINMKIVWNFLTLPWMS